MINKLAVAVLSVTALLAQGQRRTAAAPATGTASIAGRILDSATGAPVKRAVVTVEGETREARTAKAMSGDDGSFVVGELPKGKYWITAEKTGYLRGSYRGRTAGGYGDPVELADGASKSGVDVMLPRQGVIAGRVVDEAGEPVERAMVQAIPVRKSSGRGLGNVTTTNDLGEFRLTKLSPGNYKLLASRGSERMEMIVDRAPGKPATAEAPTYFPGTVDAAGASPVRVNPGEERTGAEIRLQRSTVVRVAGRVAGELPAANRGARISMRGAGDVGGGMGMGRGGNDAAIGADGAFEFRNVRPGEYVLTVTSMDRGGPRTMGRQTLMVGQNDVLGVTVAAAAPPKVDGRVRADGEPPFAIGTVSVALVSTERGGGGGFGPGGAANAKTGENGTFSFASVSRERQIVTVEGLDKGQIVKGIYAAGQPLPGMDVDFSVVTGPLEIVISNKPAVISGTVEGTSPDAPRLAVWVVPDAQPLTIESWNTKKVRIKSDSPTFTFDSLRPGTYRVAAFEDAESDALNDPAFWEQLKARTATVKVGEGETGQVKVRLITAKDMEGN